jgi:hypothetical protein
MSSTVLRSLSRLMMQSVPASSIKRANSRNTLQSSVPITASLQFQHPSLSKSHASVNLSNCVVGVSSANNKKGLLPRKIADGYSSFAIVSPNSSSFRASHYSSANSKRSIKVKIIRFLEFSSSGCAVAGGSLLASNIEHSKYGFIILALSSSQMLIASIMDRKKTLIVYAASVFCFVDCLGIVRWIFQ